MMKFYITGTRRGLGKALADKYGNCESLEDCDIFINCKHDGFQQVELLFRASSLRKRIINIGSMASDTIDKSGRYAVEKKALRDANHAVYSMGINTTCINFSYFDSERVQHYNGKKLPLEYCVEIVDWIIKQPHRIKEITV